MQLGSGNRLTVHPAVVGAIGAGAIMVFPTHPEIGWALIIGGALTSILVEVNQRWPEPLEALVAHVSGRRGQRLPASYISLHDAADRLRNETLYMPLRSKAIDRGRTLNGAWDYLGIYMFRRGMTIYGRHPTTELMHAIPKEHFDGACMRGGAAELARDGFTTWTGLAVRRDEFEARLEELKRMD